MRIFNTYYQRTVKLLIGYRPLENFLTNVIDQRSTKQYFMVKTLITYQDKSVSNKNHQAFQQYQRCGGLSFTVLMKHQGESEKIDPITLNKPSVQITSRSEFNIFNICLSLLLLNYFERGRLQLRFFKKNGPIISLFRIPHVHCSDFGTRLSFANLD